MLELTLNELIWLHELLNQVENGGNYIYMGARETAREIRKKIDLQEQAVYEDELIREAKYSKK